MLSTVLLYSCNFKKENQKNAENEVELAGAGATFPLPYYNMAFKLFRDSTNHTVSYGGIGSGGGVRSFKDKTVDFAGSDAYLSDKEMNELQEVVHIPTCLGAVVLAYNIPEISNLNLTSDIIANIFLGKITKWNDSQIQLINQGITLPDKKIIPVYRSDGSGTTFVFTDYLTKVNETWQTKIGRGKSVEFPTGIAAKGNPGISGTVFQTDGSIGYIGSEYAFAQQIKIATLQNRAGVFVKPSTESISAAAQCEIPKDTRTMITDSPIRNAYPISCFTWIIVYKEQNYGNRTLKQAQATVELLKYMLSDETQALTSKIHYAPIPQALRKQSLDVVKAITYNGKSIN